jgi:hypothetical protein
MATHRFNPTFTDNVINAMGPKTTPRVRKLMAGAHLSRPIEHLHAGHPFVDGEFLLARIVVHVSD